MVNIAKSVLLSALAAAEVAAHPGANHRAEAEARARGLANLKTRSLDACASKLEARGVNKANVARRAAAAAALSRKTKRATLAARDYPDVLHVSHHSNLDLSGKAPKDVDPSVIFAGKASCALIPETSQGPYYVTGEFIRSNVVEDQVGVPLWLDVQVINTNTCDPLPDVALDIWHCNSVGVYSGIDYQAGAKTTWLRGIQATDKEGVARFQSIVPGHYIDRATHIHLLAHSPGSWSTLPNGTIKGGNMTPHIGQIFFDMDLLKQVYALAPYTPNKQAWTSNDVDSIVKQEAVATGVDPMVSYVLLGDSVEDGVFAWIQLALDPTAEYEVDSAAFHTPDGSILDPCFDELNLTPQYPPNPKPAFCTASVASAEAKATAAPRMV